MFRGFRKKPNLMDDIRKTTSREEYNGKQLVVELDSKTRWSSTLHIIESALCILPALNNVLCRHGEPISTSDTLALREIASVLSQFKRGIVLLCSEEATLSHADKVFSLLLRDLEDSGTELAMVLLSNLKVAIAQRRTILPNSLAVLQDPSYDHGLERAVQQRIPSHEEILEVLVDIVDAEASPAQPVIGRPAAQG